MTDLILPTDMSRDSNIFLIIIAAVVLLLALALVVFITATHRHIKNSAYLARKYWRRHTKSAFAVLFSGTLMSAIVFATMLSARETVAREYHRTFDWDGNGNYDVIIANSNDELLEKAVQDRSGYFYSYVNVYGQLEKDGQSYLYGTIYDEHNVYHMPIDEGRLPETADEIAVPRVLLDKWSWAGKCGDIITIEDKTYTVVGIIGEGFLGRYDNELTEIPGAKEEMKGTPYKIPSLFVGENDEKPQFRIDMLAYLFTKEERANNGYNPLIGEYAHYLEDIIPYGTDRWFKVWDKSYYGSGGSWIDKLPSDFFMIIAYISAAVSILSVFVVLRNVFSERRTRIEMLKKIGMSKSAVGNMYAVECVIFIIVQTVLGYLVGLAAYWGIFLFKTTVLGEKPYSAFTNDIKQVRDERDPFLYTALLSAAVVILGYVINIIISKISEKNRAKLKKSRKPRSLAGSFRKIFRQSGVTFIQTIALTLICFAVLIGLAFYSDEGKTGIIYLMNSLDVNGMDMERNNIAEYYNCTRPITSAVGDGETILRFVDTNYTVGIGDDLAEQLPDCTISSGYLEQTFVVSNEEKYLPQDLFDTSDDTYRKLVLNYSDKKQQNFFDEGNIGSKYLYQAKTKLLDSRTIATLSEYVKSGSINVDALNSGEEILVVYRQGAVIPKYEVGETLTVGSISASESGYGVGGIVTSDVKVGAVLRIPNDNETSELIKKITSETESRNFLTTVAGAEKLGLHCARYTDIYSSETIDGGIFPSSAEMKLTSLAALKREKYIKKAIQYGGTTMILLVMSLLGFAAYFNGIGMKIRLKSYDISVLRAIGTPVSALRRKLILSSIKIPLIASSVAYGLARLVQFIMLDAQHRYDALCDELYYDPIAGGHMIVVGGEPLPGEYKLKSLQQNYFLDYCMWEVKLEIPALILFAVLCAVTFILTAMALKKFRRDIAFDLSSGRTRQ